MGYFSADRVRWVPFFGVPLAFSAMYEDTSSVTAVAFDCFLAVFIQLGAAIGTLKRSMAFTKKEEKGDRHLSSLVPNGVWERGDFAEKGALRRI
jgi:hypothetical protein